MSELLLPLFYDVRWLDKYSVLIILFKLPDFEVKYVLLNLIVTLIFLNPSH